MVYEADGITFTYDRALFKIHVEREQEALDCIELDYNINSEDDFESMCRKWITRNQQ